MTQDLLKRFTLSSSVTIEAREGGFTATAGYRTSRIFGKDDLPQLKELVLGWIGLVHQESDIPDGPLMLEAPVAEEPEPETEELDTIPPAVA